VAVYAWGLPLRRRVAVLAGLAVLIVAVLAVQRSGVADGLFGKQTRTAGYRLDYWSATWSMIRDHPWLGVGPGNFSRYYPRYMAATAHEKIQDPHNFLLEIWSTAGIFALAALLVTLGAWFWRVRVATRIGDVPPPASPPADAGEPPLRWEFYLGGMGGLILGFLLRASGLSQDEILTEGVVSAGRSIIWFVAFAAFDGIIWSGRWRTLALAGGVAALLINLSVSGGLSSPSVALPMWAVVALTLNGLPQDAPHRAVPSGPGRLLPVPLTAAVALLYFLLIYQPVTASFAAMTEARGYYAPYAGELAKAEVRLKEKADTPARERLQLVAGPSAIAAKLILPAVERARAADPGNVTPLKDLAHWKGQLWKLNPVSAPLREQALAAVEAAQRLDPEGREAYLVEYDLRLLFADAAREAGNRDGANQELGRAAKAVREVVRRDPTEARLRYQLADVLFRAGGEVDGREQAHKALQLDDVATEPGRKLTDAQREQARKWVSERSG
jgi:hypothetical protein